SPLRNQIDRMMFAGIPQHDIFNKRPIPDLKNNLQMILPALNFDDAQSDNLNPDWYVKGKAVSLRYGEETTSADGQGGQHFSADPAVAAASGYWIDGGTMSYHTTSYDDGLGSQPYHQTHKRLGRH